MPAPIPARRRPTVTATTTLRTRAGTDRPAYRSIDPATGQLVTEVPTAADTEEIGRAHV